MNTTFKIYFLFIFPNFLALLFFLFFPGQAELGDSVLLILLNLLFIIFVLIVSQVIYFCFSYAVRNNKGVWRDVLIDNIWVNKNVKILFLLPLAGVIFLIYDRVYLRGINYFSAELRAARYEWLSSDGGGFFGILGNMLLPFSYVAIVFAVKYYKNTSHGLLLIISSFFCIFTHAFLNGGRSNLLLMLVMFLTMYGAGYFNINIRLILNKFFLLLLIIVFTYFFVVFESSGNIGDVNSTELLRLAIIELKGIPSQNYFSYEHSDFLNFILYSFLYLFHGQWTSQTILSLNETPGYHFIVSMPLVFLDKLGFIDLGLNLREFSDYGAFVSLPGSLFYDFSWIGVAIGGGVFGVFLGLTLIVVKDNKRYGFFQTVLIFITLPNLILSPVLPVHGFAYFSLIFYAFVMFFLGNIIFFKRKAYL